MLFSSITFLYYFLPCVFFVYFIVPNSWKNIVLLIFSLLFYAWGEPTYVLYMLGSICVGYTAGRLIQGCCDRNVIDMAVTNDGGRQKSRYPRSRKAAGIMIVSVALHVIVLFFFKISPTLPIGISFYSFQVISYIIDVYRQEVKAQRNILNFATYVSLFPQLIAGPIVRYIDIEKQLVGRKHTLEKTVYGIRRFVIGLAKKVLIANALGELCVIFKESDEKSILFYWMYAVAFTLHIYFDFSGYSDMAIGLGKIFGFDFLENFNYPYISSSVTEFWRRWHMSLGSWFRDYVYIPLGGNRVSRPRYYLNILVVWALTGLWHGGAWNFVAWGLYFAVLLIVEKTWLLKYLDKSRVWKHVYLLLAVIIGFVLFDAASITEAVTRIGAMFGLSNVLGLGSVPVISAEAVYYLKSYGMLFVMGIVGATPVVKTIAEKVFVLRLKNYNEDLPEEKSQGGYKMVLNIIETIVLVSLLMICTAYLVDGSFNPFLYFRF